MTLKDRVDVTKVAEYPKVIMATCTSTPIPLPKENSMPKPFPPDIVLTKIYRNPGPKARSQAIAIPKKITQKPQFTILYSYEYAQKSASGVFN